MKIVTWNSASKFREKFTSIIEEDADIYVIQECENPDEVKVNEYKEFAGNNYFWIGDLNWKGLGIFAKDNIKLQPIEGLNDKFKNFIALKVNDSFNLLGVWAMDKDKEKGLPPYVQMIHDYFDANRDLFEENLIMCGDFNSNAIWNNQHKAKDSEGNAKNQTNLNKKLNNKGLFSAYHELTGEKQGEETQYTFYQSRHLDKPYHIDYVYTSRDRVIAFQIGDSDKWIELSDHMPITFEINEE